MKYVYLVFEYHPKHKYAYMIYEGRYSHIPKVFLNYKDALDYKKKYIHASYIRKVILR